ncbi:hypothetical protein BH09VER1_BH09VER1_09790 [soil metagenome]
MKKTNTLSGQQGFSLVELLVVIAVIGIIAAIAIPNIANITGQAQYAKDQRNAQSIASVANAAIAAGYTGTGWGGAGATAAQVIDALSGTPGVVVQQSNGSPMTFSVSELSQTEKDGIISHGFLDVTGSTSIQYKASGTAAASASPAP